MNTGYIPSGGEQCVLAVACDSRRRSDAVANMTEKRLGTGHDAWSHF